RDCERQRTLLYMDSHPVVDYHVLPHTSTLHCAGLTVILTVIEELSTALNDAIKI
ncbi:unnamed protein product, partial [Allacma fusca]